MPQEDELNQRGPCDLTLLMCQNQSHSSRRFVCMHVKFLLCESKV